MEVTDGGWHDSPRKEAGPEAGSAELFQRGSVQGPVGRRHGGPAGKGSSRDKTEHAAVGRLLGVTQGQEVCEPPRHGDSLSPSRGSLGGSKGLWDTRAVGGSL